MDHMSLRLAVASFAMETQCGNMLQLRESYEQVDCNHLNILIRIEFQEGELKLLLTVTMVSLRLFWIFSLLFIPQD